MGIMQSFLQKRLEDERISETADALANKQVSSLTLDLNN